MTRQNLWREAAEAIIRLDAIYPRSQDCFLDCWLKPCPGLHHAVSSSLGDDPAIALLRRMLPAYCGYDTILFRGQPEGPPGRCWSADPKVALWYALYGERDKFPLELDGGRAGAVVLQAIVPAANIICAPALMMKNNNAEYIIDPRGFEYSIQPAEEAAGWIIEHTESMRNRALRNLIPGLWKDTELLASRLSLCSQPHSAYTAESPDITS
ncbi:hypothetical protein [Bradyrhizobium sp. AUGA SZCCT0431]|uniref:hypothetical protein n=1 Tax=Bradyrhizobium sp. AUGA SZCCT0431 TaxID=2807674 RepID=UPI001BA89CCE|nr:hypothetical protein [Bradyrhizobium sp. AUGA SZCCT0431]MBR1145075.1 hypothetical protein [Bradyrhizobium sp. AUGA SZCCT0431]